MADGQSFAPRAGASPGTEGPARATIAGAIAGAAELAHHAATLPDRNPRIAAMVSAGALRLER